MQLQQFMQDKYIKLTIALKLNQMKRTQLSSLTYDHVESTLMQQWSLQMPSSIHDAINQIMKLHANDVVASLSMQVMTKSKANIQDFEDLFKG